LHFTVIGVEYINQKINKQDCVELFIIVPNQRAIAGKTGHKNVVFDQQNFARFNLRSQTARGVG